MRALWSRFQVWNHASLLRRTVVTVAGFVMLACLAIATMSFAAVSATQAVFKPVAPGASVATAGSGSAGVHGPSADVGSEADEAAGSPLGHAPKTAAAPTHHSTGSGRAKARSSHEAAADRAGDE